MCPSAPLVPQPPRARLDRGGFASARIDARASLAESADFSVARWGAGRSVFSVAWRTVATTITEA
jgi:hypothetical protein